MDIVFMLILSAVIISAALYMLNKFGKLEKSTKKEVK